MSETPISDLPMGQEIGLTLDTVLIANRGEIAVRVIRSCRALGYGTVAVYSEADADAPHVALADVAVCIGPAAVAESYLSVANILAAARASGADAIHPGYGFLSENADFARACVEAGLVFIGPGAEAIELMGSKRRSRAAMLAAGVPCIPGYHGEAQDEDTLIARAREIGFPLMIKASAGGGGRGMRLVHEESDLAGQIRTACSEARNAFGDGELILERALQGVRHIEIQVFADAHRNVVHLGERDCSIQRRHQKVIEEAPSPFMDAVLRRRMGEAAVRAARGCDYRGAGTVEFLVDENRDFFFLEMNTRLQVEHPVTEMITGQDLVAWQLRVASGGPLPLTQDEIRCDGHAIEVRLYAEDPRRHFLPQTGHVLRWVPSRRPGVRVDDGIAQGQTIAAHYDPLLAKFVAHGADRETARRRLACALRETSLLGVNNNKAFLYAVLRHPVFALGQADTNFIERHFSGDASVAVTEPAAGSLARAALACYLRGKRQSSGHAAGAWRRALPEACVFRLACAGAEWTLRLRQEGDRYHVSVGDQQLELTVPPGQALEEAGRMFVIENGVGSGCDFAFENSASENGALDSYRIALDDGGGHFVFDDITHAPAEATARAGDGQVEAAMDGAIVAVLVRQGETVARGQTVIVLEAMKMEHQLCAGLDGVVETLSVTAGQQVRSRQVLARIAPARSEPAADKR